MPSRHEDRPLVGEIDRRHLDAFVGDVLPHIELRPIGQWEDPDVLPLVVTPVEQIPELWALVLRVPLAVLVTEAVDPLLGTRLLLVTTSTAEEGVEFVSRIVRNSVGVWSLFRVRPRPGLVRNASGIDVILHVTNHQPDPEAFHRAVTKLENFGEVSPCIDMQDRERRTGRKERLACQVQHDDGVLPAREHQCGPLEFGGHLSHDVDRLGLERAQVRQLVRAGCCRGRLRFPAPARRVPNAAGVLPWIWPSDANLRHVRFDNSETTECRGSQYQPRSSSRFAW